jgi:hypothetical protein
VCGLPYGWAPIRITIVKKRAKKSVARVAQSGQKICTEKRMSFVLEPRARYLNGWGSDHEKRSPIPTENG